MSSIECPFCQQDNRCTVNSNSCWCQLTHVPSALIDLLPDAVVKNATTKSCICVTCVESYQKSPLLFKAQINGKAK
ncbi:cysteine-rich CWC family protein [Psychromonas sp. Urea-02u-13]|uniref:cysteine-rich CWC family protein n=1 Tax=Psychromonas sp. Urea-02u-13 TaxID=2058326 RepID=UPI0012FF1B9A